MKQSRILDRLPLNLFRARAAAQLSQSQLAERTGLSVSYLSMLEHGRRAPSFTTLETLARSLRVETLDLLRAV